MQKLDKKETGKKKGILAIIWESMTKTGGCCGSGGDCCGPAKPEEKPAESAPDTSGERASK